MTDFIEVTERALSPEHCRQIIERFEASPHLTAGQVGGGVDRTMKDSRDVTISHYPEWQDVEQLLNNTMMLSLCAYLRKFPHMLIAPLAIGVRDPATGGSKRLGAEDVSRMGDQDLVPIIRYAFRPGHINVQGYKANQGGYPYWHCENYPRDRECDALHRVLLWSVYLNEEFEAGETEFLYQQRLVKPRTGSLVLAPAGFTHTHRGNRPIGGDKYIATSWILFQRAEHLFPQG